MAPRFGHAPLPLSLLPRLRCTDPFARSLLVGVGAPLGPTLHNADEAAVVHKALLGAACEDLLLLRLGHLRRLVLHLTGACQTAVHLAHLAQELTGNCLCAAALNGNTETP